MIDSVPAWARAPATRLAVDDRVLERAREGVVGLWPDARDGPAQQRMQPVEVVTEHREGGVGRYRLHSLQPHVVVGYERDVRVAELELAGEPAFRVLRHVDHVEAAFEVPPRLRPRGETRTLDHDDGPALYDGYALLEGGVHQCPAQVGAVGVCGGHMSGLRAVVEG